MLVPMVRCRGSIMRQAAEAEHAVLTGDFDGFWERRSVMATTRAEKQQVSGLSCLIPFMIEYLS